jgi:glutamate N-acetyltransferase/amino-acid N-acetyltransferase
MSQEAWKIVSGGIAAPAGFYASGVKAGVKYEGKYDVALIKSAVPARAAGLFTRNLVKAHPLLLTERHLQDGTAQAIIVNSGNANACMGETGEKAALEMAEITAGALGLPVSDVLVSSTGVIGQKMPMEKIIPGIREVSREIAHLAAQAEESARNEQAHRAALAIMTTDTTVKEMEIGRAHV